MHILKDIAYRCEAMWCLLIGHHWNPWEDDEHFANAQWRSCHFCGRLESRTRAPRRALRSTSGTDYKAVGDGSHIDFPQLGLYAHCNEAKAHTENR